MAQSPHHPEIIFLVPVNDMHLRVEPGSGEFCRPEMLCLLVELRSGRLSLCIRRIITVAPSRFFQKLPD